MKGHPVLPFTPDLACYVDFVSKVITEASAHTGARKPPRVAGSAKLSLCDSPSHMPLPVRAGAAGGDVHCA